MKTSINGLLKSRITRRTLLTTLVPTAGLSVALADSKGNHSPGQGRYQLGGAFIGSGGGMVWNCYQIPLDPAGRTAALKVKPVTYGADVAGLLASFGADGFTEATGEEVMTGFDSAKWSFIGYAVKTGNPPLIQGILVYTGTLKFTDPDTFAVDYILDAYAATADANKDGFPDPGAKPVLSIPGSGVGKRVPLP